MPNRTTANRTVVLWRRFVDTSVHVDRFRFGDRTDESDGHTGGRRARYALTRLSARDLKGGAVPMGAVRSSFVCAL